MRRQCMEYIKPTLTHFSTHISYVLWRKIHMFFYWYTLDYDVGYAFVQLWFLWFIYLSIGLLHSYTGLFHLLHDIFLGAIDFCTYSFSFCITMVVKYWLPCIVASVVGIGALYSYYKEKKEKDDLMWSYVDDEDDVPVYMDDILPVPGATPLWGARDEDTESIEDFTAPTLYLKISGIVGYYPGLSVPATIGRINKALKDKLAPNVRNGEYPWTRMSIKTDVALIYVHFKTIQDATNCFNTLDGFTFDGMFQSVANSSYLEEQVTVRKTEQYFLTESPKAAKNNSALIIPVKILLENQKIPPPGPDTEIINNKDDCVFPVLQS